MSTLSIAETERASSVQPLAAEPAATPGVRVADQIVSLLEEVGVDMVFGLPGGAIAPLFDALMDSKRIRVANFRHENNAVFAAAAYARATEKLGVVLVTSGPGVTNAITGLGSAYLDGLPVLVIAGEIARSNVGRGALQEGSRYFLDVVGLAEHITKFASEIPSADAAAALVRKAMYTALSGRKGPTFLSLPMDVAATVVQPPRVAARVESGFQVKGPVLDAAIHALWQAQRPVILAGSGTRWGKGPEELRLLAEHIQCPVMTTPKAKGVFPEGHPLSLGVFGYGGHPSAMDFLEKGADVILAVGTSFGEVATNNWSPLLGKSYLIQVDIDGAEIGRNYPANLGIVGPAVAALPEIRAQLPRAAQQRTFGITYLSDASAIVEGGRIKPQRALWELQQVLPKNTIYTCDIGEHTMVALHYLHLDRPDAFYVYTGMGAMGSGNGAAIGLKLAYPERCVVAVCGDGTISMTGVELATATQYKLGMLFVVMNDGGYGMVERGNKTIYGRTPRYELGHLDVHALAESVGAEAVTIKAAGDVLALDLPRMLSGARPVVLNVEIDGYDRPPRLGRVVAIRRYVN